MQRRPTSRSSRLTLHASYLLTTGGPGRGSLATPKGRSPWHMHGDPGSSHNPFVYLAKLALGQLHLSQPTSRCCSPALRAWVGHPSYRLWTIVRGWFETVWQPYG